jgi:hypothetical protein
VRFDALPPKVEKELVPIRKAVDSLRAAVSKHRPPEALERSNAAVLAIAGAYDQAIKKLAPLGFTSLGDAGDWLDDGSVAVSRWFGHSEGTICGWLGFVKGKNGQRLVVVFVTEASGPAFCTTVRGATGMSLARPPNVSEAHHAISESLAEVVRGHRQRVSSLTAAGKSLTTITTLEEAIEIMERLHDNRVTWRASMQEQDLLRADLTSVLAHIRRKWGAKDFWLSFSHAADWLDFPREPSSGALGDDLQPTPGPLSDLLTSNLSGPEAERGTPGIESDWLLHCEFELQGTRLQILDVFMAGNDDEGVILGAFPGVYVVEAKVITYGVDRRISRVRVRPIRQLVTQGQLAGTVGVDLGAVAICDVDRLAAWASGHNDEWQRWGEKLWFGRITRAGLYTCEAAKTIVPFIDSGFGDGTYPLYYLMHGNLPVGLEAEFISQ